MISVYHWDPSVDEMGKRGGREGSPSQFAWREGRAPEKGHTVMGRA